MRRLLQFISILSIPITLQGQRLAIGHTSPVAKLDVRSVDSDPAIPAGSSYAIFRIGVGAAVGMDIGKSTTSPYPAWIQVGNSGAAEPISINPLGGNVGIGLLNPSTRLDINGILKVNGKITNVTNLTSAQDAATKTYVDQLQTQINQLEAQTVTDVNHNEYGTVTIGSQVWMTENLRATNFNSGAAISLVTNATAWANTTEPAYTWYNNGNGDYGALYNFYTVTTPGSNVCPTGWHVPTWSEVADLKLAVGGAPVAGGNMKESGLSHWNPPNTAGTNSSGFKALPGGFRFAAGSFGGVEVAGSWWMADAYDETSGYNFEIVDNNGGCFTDNAENNYGLSIRCIKN